ncbi:MAG: hypothetical protein LBI92_06600 [Azoarcus sp.]|jgi:hypothetical protein|nr:hypothetical protein [Azoarcus sp.]
MFSLALAATMKQISFASSAFAKKKQACQERFSVGDEKSRALVGAAGGDVPYGFRRLMK